MLGSCNGFSVLISRPYWPILVGSWYISFLLETEGVSGLSLVDNSIYKYGSFKFIKVSHKNLLWPFWVIICVFKCRKLGNRLYLGLVVRKPVFRVCNKVMLKPACSATETR